MPSIQNRFQSFTRAKRNGRLTAHQGISFSKIAQHFRTRSFIFEQKTTVKKSTHRARGATVRRCDQVSDLTRGNLVFGSLNSKRSRVSLAWGGEAGRTVARGKRMTGRSSPRGSDEVACVLCVGRGVSGECEIRGGRRTNERQLDSAVGFGTRRDYRRAETE